MGMADARCVEKSSRTTAHFVAPASRRCQTPFNTGETPVLRQARVHASLRMGDTAIPIATCYGKNTRGSGIAPSRWGRKLSAAPRLARR
jgi:hypothetical protein